MSTAQEIRAALEPVLAPLGLVVEDVTVSPAGRRRVVRVLVDSDLGGLDAADTTTPVPPLSLDTVADATRAVSDELDTSEVMGSAPYVLEVSSPGVGRALTSHDQFRRQVGRLVEVDHRDGTDTGRLVEVGSDALVLDVAPTKKVPARRVTLDLDTVSRGTVQVEFRRSDPAGTDDDPAGPATTRTPSTPEEES
jgi:ribosome maturation factor RimP